MGSKIRRWNGNFTNYCRPEITGAEIYGRDGKAGEKTPSPATPGGSEQSSTILRETLTNDGRWKEVKA